MSAVAFSAAATAAHPASDALLGAEDPHSGAVGRYEAPCFGYKLAPFYSAVFALEQQRAVRLCGPVLTEP